MYDSNKQSEFFLLSKELLTGRKQVSDYDTLVDLLQYHEWKYYIENDPVIADYEYDRLYQMLLDYEDRHPEMIRADSPSQRVSSDLTPSLDAVRHIVPMLSLANSYNEDDLAEFDRQIKKLTGIEGDVEYSIEPKLDGGSIALVYEDDLLARAATRGNGTEGEEITANAKAIPSIPLSAEFSRYGIKTAEVRGEAVIAINVFNQKNDQRQKEGLTLWANPRNAATGGLRLKDANESRNRGLEAFIFQLAYAVNDAGNDILHELASHGKSIEILSQLGFKLPLSKPRICRNINEAVDAAHHWEKIRDTYAYEIDGAVIKVNRFDLQDLCGATQHHPRWAIAFKFKAKQATTTLQDVEFQIGRTGAVTPVAKVRPVHLAGVTVSSISLHNEDFIIQKDLRIGDQVLIERAGDVIPYIVKSLPDLRTGDEQPIDFPKECPFNTTDQQVHLVKSGDEAAWRCPQCICGAQDLQRIIFHVSKDAMNIDGLGKSLVERFFDLGWIKDISDVYALDYDKIRALEGFGDKSADNLRDSIDKAKQNPLHKLLLSLGIHHFGKKASKLIAQHIQSVYDLAEWTLEDFTVIKDIGPVVAQNVMDYFNNEANVAMLRRMEERGVNVTQTDQDKPVETDEDAVLAGKTILFTGTLQQMGRKEAQQLAEKAGAMNISAVSKNLDILVVGEKAGSKLKKATALGTVDILTEEEFLNLINS